MYLRHPSEALTQAFRARPFQGADPRAARAIFVGLDANYGEAIDQSPVFSDVLDYLADGVRFCKVRGVHHPFLLSGYRGDGRKYHKTFARIAITSQNATDISFVELLHVPTVGRSVLTLGDLDVAHLRWINSVITTGAARAVFIPTAVAAMMRRSRVFPWLPDTPTDIGRALKIWRKLGPTTVYWHYHFSVYGKFESKKAEQLMEIRELLSADTSPAA